MPLTSSVAGRTLLVDVPLRRLDLEVGGLGGQHLETGGRVRAAVVLAGPGEPWCCGAACGSGEPCCGVPLVLLAGPLLLAGAAACEVPAHAACTHCCRQERPLARPQRMPLAWVVARRTCRGRGVSAVRWHPLWFAGPPAGEVPGHGACIHCRLQDLPQASYQRMALASSVACRTCRWRGVC